MSHRWLPTFSGRWNFQVAVTRPSLQSYCLAWNALDQRGRRNGLERLVHAFSNQIGDFTATCESLIQRAEARVLFVRTVTNSLALSAFGRRLARCFPLRRARRIKVAWTGGQLTAAIEAGGGSAPELFFEGEQSECPEATQDFRSEFATYDEYARWIINQHLSVVLWPREYVVQDMHLDFQKARITPLRCLRCDVSGVQDFVPEDGKPLDCFAVENLRVFLDNIYAVMMESGGK